MPGQIKRLVMFPIVCPTGLVAQLLLLQFVLGRFCIFRRCRGVVSPPTTGCCLGWLYGATFAFRLFGVWCRNRRM
jgi:hypothetical protein